MCHSAHTLKGGKFAITESENGLFSYQRTGTNLTTRFTYLFQIQHWGYAEELTYLGVNKHCPFCGAMKIKLLRAILTCLKRQTPKKPNLTFTLRKRLTFMIIQSPSHLSPRSLHPITPSPLKPHHHQQSADADQPCPPRHPHPQPHCRQSTPYPAPQPCSHTGPE